MTAGQREQAFDLMRTAFSAKGFKLSRDIMRLNRTLGELTGDPERYSEWFYWLTFMGEPSETEPWGWQIDGHHLVVNYFVLGNQVVMSPLFTGSEPVIAESGHYKGMSVMEPERDRANAVYASLTEEQRKTAELMSEDLVADGGGRAFGRGSIELMEDNAVIPYRGIRVEDLSAVQRGSRDRVDRGVPFLRPRGACQGQDGRGHGAHGRDLFRLGSVGCVAWPG